jgi:peptidoglycan-N-acetylglucosamine deacetylase
MRRERFLEPSGTQQQFLFSVDVDWVKGSEDGLVTILDFCDRRKIPATFFVAGRFAVEYPDLIREAASRGHDVGTHGWEHGTVEGENFRHTTYDQQRRWMELSTDAVGKAAGAVPRAFRAPNLLVSETTLKVLEDLSYTHDSSVPARRHDFRMGVVNYTRYFRAPMNPYHPAKDDLGTAGLSPIVEVPPSAFFVPLNMSVLRNYGFMPVKWALARIAGRSRTIVFYVHPSEFVEPSRMELSENESPRYLKNMGKEQLGLLEQFVDLVMQRGYQPARISQVTV